MTKPSIVPPGCWPRRMTAEVAAGYCGEPSRAHGSTKDEGGYG
jgi:hypothetical protein